MSDPARILVVDDDEDVCRVIALALEKEGYVVDTANDQKEAREKINANFYNVALIDIRLPDKDGTTLLTGNRETVPKMVKIIVTGYPSLQNAIESVNRNADGYIVKPFKTEELLAVIEKQLSKQREALQYSQEKVAEYVETRLKEMNTRETGK